MMLIKLRKHSVVFTIMALSSIQLTSSAPKTWPYMKTYDIWDTNQTVSEFKERPRLLDNSLNFAESRLQSSGKMTGVSRRKAKGESNLLITAVYLSEAREVFV